MDYATVREHARNGDVLLVSGSGPVSLLVRVLTGQTISHVAVLVWLGDTLWVAEMREFRGYQLTPASLWLAESAPMGRVWFGQAPDQVHRQADAVAESALHYRGRRYGYLSLVRVWLQSVIGVRRRTRGLVCSTFAARLWEAAGYVWRVTPTPGAFLDACVSVHRLNNTNTAD